MLYRVPAELDFLLPSYPIDDSVQSRPWRGDLSWSGVDNDPNATDTHLSFVHAVETEGDIRADLWPTSLSLRSSRSGFSLPDVHAWVQNIAPPLCVFMPGQLRHASQTKSNQSAFRAFANTLRDRQIVAVSRWNGPNHIPGSGLIIFPVAASPGLLAAAVFHSQPIPDFFVPTPSTSYDSSLDVPRSHFSSLPSLDMQFYHQHMPQLSNIASPTCSPSPILRTPPTLSTPNAWQQMLKHQPAPSSPSYATPRTQFLHNAILPADLRDRMPSTPVTSPSNYVLQGHLSSDPPLTSSLDINFSAEELEPSHVDWNGDYFDAMAIGHDYSSPGHYGR